MNGYIFTIIILSSVFASYFLCMFRFCLLKYFTKKSNAFEKLMHKNIIYNNLNQIDSSLECSICLNKFENNENSINKNKLFIKLDCDHIFHKLCIEEWYNTSIYCTCPICRKEIKIKEYLI